ncbi:receptor-type tyrosine-protein phosphatase T-like [Mya arenaria]|uniref:receptor-type tyrosine-protein phosphatase T-like n=1 Tax=Mya arenaria TaxID=6604 RepID=UPI0022E03460|nr:receptor-type tyrosine-protein phosphatase T-like [Mya arenaria]
MGIGVVHVLLVDLNVEYAVSQTDDWSVMLDTNVTNTIVMAAKNVKKGISSMTAIVMNVNTNKKDAHALAMKNATDALDTINCKICNEGYYPNSSGECELCNSQCVNNECDSSSGECNQGCTNGYWNKACDKACDPECVSCSQPDGACTHCKNNTKYGPICSMECSTNCKNSMCVINGDCTNGCIINKFGKQCEQTCENYCTQKENRTVCSEKTGICLYGCEKGDKGSFCPSAQAEQQMSTASLGGGVGGGVVALAAIVVVGLILLRSRRGNLSNRSERPEKEHDNSSALYATVNKGRAQYANEDTVNLHSVTNIENTNYQSPPPKSSDKDNTRIFTEDNLEIEADDVSAREITNMFENNEGVHYNNTRAISKFKLTVVELPDYVQNICIKDLEEEFQKVPYGLVKPYEVSQTKLNMHRNRYKGIYPYDDTRVLVRGGDTDYINASYIDGFRKRNAYIASLGPMAKQLGDFGQFWRMIWQQKVEKIVMLTNLVESLKTKCEQYWPDHGQRKLYGDIEVVCKVNKMYADLNWRQLTISKRIFEFARLTHFTTRLSSAIKQLSELSTPSFPVLFSKNKRQLKDIDLV